MKHALRASLLATTLALGALTFDGFVAPAAAQDVSVDFDSFHDALAPYGDWVYSDRWGEVWEPDNVSDDFHPYYTNGRWVDTDDYGWTWQSDYDWGDVPFHYGRWVSDPDDGWLWIPGYVWSPGWVVWRSNDRYTGWMPMPPDDAFLRGDDEGGGPNASIAFNFGGDNGDYGYSRWYGRGYDENRFAMNWTFVDTGHLTDRDYRAHAVARPQVVGVIHSTTNITNYTVVNNFVVNRSVNTAAVVKAGGHPVQPVRAATIFRRPTLITSATVGRSVQVRMRAVQPRGTGVANSAPAPSAAIVKTLSPRAPAHGGKPSAHLFTRDTVVHAQLKPAPAGATPMAPAGGAHPPPTPSTVTPANAAPGDTTHDRHERAGAMGSSAAAPTPATDTAHRPGHDEAGPAMSAPTDIHAHKPPAVTPAEPSAPPPGIHNGRGEMPASAVEGTTPRVVRPAMTPSSPAETPAATERNREHQSTGAMTPAAPVAHPVQPAGTAPTPHVVHPAETPPAPDEDRHKKDDKKPVPQ